MKIAIVAHGLSDGGAERVASLIANYYTQKGHDVLFIAAYSPERVYTLHDAVKYVYLGGNYRTKLSRAIFRSYAIDREINHFHADAVVSFIITELIYTSFIRKIPVIHSLRIDPGQACETFINNLTCVLAYQKATKIVFQTPAARDYFPPKIREKGIVIANPLTRNLPQWEADTCKKTVITACRLNEQKNLPMLITAFATFHKTHPDYSLEIYGDGHLLDELKAYAKECGIAGQVSFPGYAKNIHEIMSHSGIFALTSDYEGLSNSMLEALAIGIPTVCTDCPPGGAALYIEDGVSGMLVPVGDTEALTKKLCQMADDPQLCRQMSKNSQKIREELDVDKVLKQWESALQ